MEIPFFLNTDKYDDYVQELLEELAETSYDDNYQTTDYELLNGMSQRFTLSNGMRITF